ncbi:hypothetical protein ACFQ1S_21420, partial [Kibdelosporangium lantanae]
MKASTRKTKDGQVIRYLQLAHNEWDADAGVSRTKVLYSFGREDTVDVEGIRRLIGSLTRLLDPAEALAGVAGGGPAGLTFTESRPLGGAFVLDALKINQAMSRYSQGNFGTPAQLRAAVDAAVQALDTELAPYLDQSGQLDQAKLTPAAQAEITRLQDNLKAAVERQNQYLTDLGTQADQLAKDARPRQAEVNHLAAKA